MPAGGRHRRRPGQCGRWILGQVVTVPCGIVVDAPKPRLVELTTEELEAAPGGRSDVLL